MTRNWENVFQGGQGFTPGVIALLQQLEAEIAANYAASVHSVSAADASVTVGGTATDPTLSASGGGGGSQTLEEVLTEGNDGGGLDIANVALINATGIVGASLDVLGDGSVFVGDGDWKTGGNDLDLATGGSIVGVEGITFDGTGGTLDLDGAGIEGIGTDLSLESNKITNLGDPSANSHAVNRGWANAHVGGEVIGDMSDGVVGVSGGALASVQAAFVANGSTVDQLRDSLIAAGLMAAS